MDENINLTILNEINKAAKMGMDSISYVLDKTEDENLRDNLSAQYSGYDDISNRVNTEFERYGEIPDDNSIKNKVMTWAGVQMNTMNDRSSSHIAEIMIQGNSMGIVEAQKLINHNPKAENQIKNILNDFVTFQKNNIEKMKKFL